MQSVLSQLLPTAAHSHAKRLSAPCLWTSIVFVS